MPTQVFFTLACAGVIAYLFGLAMTFAGYKFFMILLPVWGFFFGLWLGAQSVQVLFGGGFLATVTSWVIAFIVGAVFAVLAYLFYLVAVAIIAGSLGYYVAVGLLLWIGLQMNLLVWLIGIVAAIALAAVTLIFNLQKWVIIFATAILGAGMIVGVFGVLFNPAARFLENPVRVMLQTSPLLMFLFLALVIFGIIVQARTTRRLKEGGPSAAAVSTVPPTVSTAAPAPLAGEAAPAATAAAAAAGIAAISYEAKAEPAPVESPTPETPAPEAPAAVIPAAEIAAAEVAAAEAAAAAMPVEETPPAAVPAELAAAGAVAAESEAAPAGPEEIAKFKYNLEYIEGIGPVYAAKLNEIGIANPLDLLEKGAFPKGRQEIAEAAGISPTLVLKWVNHVDLFRIKGVGSEYADLLEMAGVDTVVELATRNPANLFAKIESVNEEKKLVRKLPVLAQVQDWVEQAKSLPRKINY
jgi:predicted flap endonuclease-1-like 5' DNA nuclease